MSGPTLLVPGALRAPAGHATVAPVAFIIAWLKKRMPEYGGMKAALADRILVVRSETGSGKSTVLPVHIFRILRSAATRGRYNGPSVLCTQPRVLTAIDLSTRQVGGTHKAPNKHYPEMIVGETVGFQTGPFSEKPAAGLIFATIGILTAQLRTMPDDALMEKYRFIIIDEAHERSVEAEATLMRLKQFYVRNAGNRKLPFLLLTSATIDTLKYARFFLGSESAEENIIEIEGRQFPVAEIWPTVGSNNYPESAAKVAIAIHEKNPDDKPQQADILIFMPGDAETKIVRALLDDYIASCEGAPFLVLAINREAILEESPQYRLVTAAKLPLVKKQAPVRRIIVSTVVAETGLTIDTLKYIIDCGWSRMFETYQPAGVGGLITRPAARSRILQRRGRVGRVAPGQFYPLYTKSVYDALDPAQLPDIATNGMSGIVLDLVATCSDAEGVFDYNSVGMLDPPPPAAFAAALGTALHLGLIAPTAQTATATQSQAATATQSQAAAAAQSQTATAPRSTFTLTTMGAAAAKFSRTSPECARLILAGYAWECSIRDLVTICAVFGTPIAALLKRPKKASNKLASIADSDLNEAEYFDVLGGAKSPSFDIKKNPTHADSKLANSGAKPVNGSGGKHAKRLKYLGGGTQDPTLVPLAAAGRKFKELTNPGLARLLLADDFIEAMLVFQHIMEMFDSAGADVGAVIKYVDSLGLDISRVMAVAVRREEIFEDLLIAGLDPYWGERYALLNNPQALIPTVRKLKRCIYDGLRHRLLRYNADENKYVSVSQDVSAAVPATLSDAYAKTLGIDTFVKPAYIVADGLLFAPTSRDMPRPLLYKIVTGSISVMDGYVDIDAP